MVQTGSHAFTRSDIGHPLLSADEFGVMVCLLGVPVIWTALVSGMLSDCVETFRITLALAIVSGVAACVARLVWLCRQDPR